MQWIEDKLSVDDYLNIRECVNWKRLSREQAEKSLKGSLYILAVYDGDLPVAMGRIVGDAAVICYVQDLIVRPEYQGRKLGSKVLNRLIEKVEEWRISDTEMMLALMCAKGRENFYEKHGFMARPTSELGPGMIMYIE